MSLVGSALLLRCRMSARTVDLSHSMRRVRNFLNELQVILLLFVLKLQYHSILYVPHMQKISRWPMVLIKACTNNVTYTTYTLHHDLEKLFYPV